MFRPLLLAVLGCVLSFSFLISPTATAAKPAGSMSNVVVQLKGAPLTADHHLVVRDRETHFRPRIDPRLPAARWYSSKLSQYQTDEISYLRGLGIHLTIQYRLHALFDGFEASVATRDIPRLRQARNVKAVTLQHSPKPLLDHSLPLVNVPQAWQVFGGGQNAGKGMMIADIDTGIDIKNPCFSDKGMAPPPIARRGDLSFTNNKVIVARAFGPDPSTHYSPADTIGHGTFTAAIEACDFNTHAPKATISGVAPAAYLMNYNWSPAQPNGSAADNGFDPILPALEDAVLDGADVVNMSLGEPLSGDARLDPDEAELQAATTAGVPVVVSAGNAGPFPQTVTSPAASPYAIAVGATSNDRGLFGTVSVTGPGDVPPQLQGMKGEIGTVPFNYTTSPAQMVYVGLARKAGDDPNNKNADDLAGKNLKGKIAIIKRGVMRFKVKLQNVQNAGAVGAIFFDDHPELSTGTFDQGTATIPALFMDYEDGTALVDYVESNPDATATLDGNLTAYPVPGDVITDFSSRGYDAGYDIKPDLVAPGQNIYSATEDSVPPPTGEMYDPSGFTQADGTSFSAPHVAGAIALIMEQHRTWTPAQIKGALMATATNNVYSDAAHTVTPSVMDMGAGLLNVAGAVSAPAYLAPSSLSLGEVNVGYGPVTRSATLVLHNLGTGTGTWNVHVQILHVGSGVNLTTPTSLSLPTGGQVLVPITLNASASARTGDTDGDIVFTQGSQSIHVPFFVHVVSQPVAKGSVLLVDDTQSIYQSSPGQPPVVHVDVTKYYESALSAIGKKYTYWNEGKLGSPSLPDMQRASAVIYYTGANLNAWAPQNVNYEGLQPPLGAADVTTLHDYLNGGGRVFLSGEGAAFSDPAWVAFVAGAEMTTSSVYNQGESANRESSSASPTRPSAFPSAGTGLYAHSGIFLGLKPFDFSKKGDGVHDNDSVYNASVGVMLGVSGMKPVNGSYDFYGSAFGHKALVVPKDVGKAQVAIAASNEPTLAHRVTYQGRSVLFSFGFEGISNNTGYVTRQQVLKRIFQWFADQPSARVSVTKYPAGVRTHLVARFHSSVAGGAAEYQWQVGSHKLPGTSSPTTYTFPHPGKYRLRVLVVDRLGHAAVSPWATVTVG